MPLEEAVLEICCCQSCTFVLLIALKLDLQPALTSQAPSSTGPQPIASVGPHSPLPPVPWDRTPDLGPNWKLVSEASAVTEVHLRRLDAADQLHRRVVAVLTIDAPPEEVGTPFQHSGVVSIQAYHCLWGHRHPC